MSSSGAITMRGRELVERSDKWAAFSLHAVLLLACSGCGARSDLVGPGGSSSGSGSSSSGGSLGSSSNTGPVVLFGGASVDALLNDTWTFDGTSWTQVSISNPPP